MSTEKDDDLDIVHDEERQSFTIALGSGRAVLDYHRTGDGVLDFAHTYVPPEARGRSIAGRLVTHGLKYARAEGLKVVPSCPYVSAFIRRHSEYADLVAQ